MAKKKYGDFDIINGNRLVFEFGSERAARHFKLWMCESGEQYYWDWMRCREEEEDGPISGIKFDYWTETEVIPVECGRVSEEQ